jgi:hypothetical protein
MKSEISKEYGSEDIEACRRCRKLLKFEDRGQIVCTECTAQDRFDCPRILMVFYPKIHSLPEEVRRELIARIRSKKLTKEDAAYFS